jgi:predicted amidophosphoribosyltransferase
MASGIRAWLTWAISLLDLLMPPRPGVRLLRTLDADGLLLYLAPRTLKVRGISSSVTKTLAITALAAYTEPVIQGAVREAKFHGNVRAARLLGSLLAAYLDTGAAGLSAPETPDARSASPAILIPVPLSGERLRERGYNQAERIARAAMARSGVALRCAAAVRTDLLARTRATLPQTSLGGSDRRKNVVNCFTAPQALDPAPLYIVIDDVTTTGATLADAGRALQAGGAERILLIAVAR